MNQQIPELIKLSFKTKEAIIQKIHELSGKIEKSSANSFLNEIKNVADDYSKSSYSTTDKLGFAESISKIGKELCVYLEETSL